ncbi:MAG TPA: TrmH family RNA methyltransferase [Clostridia bacterium]|nr:TrmH family RNA methyltransferase [Clostridia bacterium]
MGSFTLGAPRAYKRDCGYSYALGAYAAIELLKLRPQAAREVYIHSAYENKPPLIELCERASVPYRVNDRALERLSKKESCLVAAAFSPYVDALDAQKPHMVLVNPSDMGNLGTVFRIAAGFSILDVGIVLPAADVFHPKTVRASMGALFRVRCGLFESFSQYRGLYPKHGVYPFLLGKKSALTPESCPKDSLFCLVFGNEAHGLDDAAFQRFGTAVRIPQSALVDSLNLSVAVGIGAYAFAVKNGLVEGG